MQDVKMLTLEGVLERRENGKPFKLVEVLARDRYEESHLPGALNIPLEDLDALAPRLLARDDDIVVYCASYACPASTRAARLLLDLGYGDVWDFKGGKAEWRKAGLDLEEGPAAPEREAAGTAT